MNSFNIKKPFVSGLAAISLVLTVEVVIAQSIDFDKKLGASNAESVKKQMGIYNNPSMTAYVGSIGQRLVNNLEKPLFEYKFHLVPDPSPNAFALPGGYIYVTTGLISILKTEDEMACILAHEIIHSNNRHSVKQMRKGIIPGLLALPGEILGIVNDKLGEIFVAPSHLLVAKYSRKYETEADVQGVQLALKSGYDPNALKAALNRMTTTIELLTGQSEEKSYFSDHPFTPDRVTRLDKELKEAKLNISGPISPTFLSNFDGLLFGQNPKFGVIHKQSILNPTLNLSVSFPEKWNLFLESGRMCGIIENQEAAIAIGTETEHATATDAANAFVQEVPEKQKNSYKRRVYTHPNGQGVLISMKETTKDVVVWAHILWLPHDGKLLKIVGMSTQDHLPTLKSIVDQMKTLSPEEKKSITIQELKSVQSSSNQTLEDLANSSKNVLRMYVVEAINEMKMTDRVDPTEWIKIIKEQPYTAP
ncbi:MAG: M48 family metalloprotease [Flavobacteriales bacterium]|nr:M48 family metalloprotease [Flavobacteriales bacterium]